MEAGETCSNQKAFDRDLSEGHRCCGFGGCTCNERNLRRRRGSGDVDAFMESLKRKGLLGVYYEDQEEATAEYWSKKGIEVRIEQISTGKRTKALICVWQIKK